MKRIGIIGTGVAGLVAAHLLQRRHDLTLFEAADWIGGHVHTVPVALAGRRWSVDTGFIVFNERTYPSFCRLLDALDVPSAPTEMSFSVRCEASGLEYSGASIDGQASRFMRHLDSDVASPQRRSRAPSTKAPPSGSPGPVSRTGSRCSSRTTASCAARSTS